MNIGTQVNAEKWINELRGFWVNELNSKLINSAHLDTTESKRATHQLSNSLSATNAILARKIKKKVILL